MTPSAHPLHVCMHQPEPHPMRAVGDQVMVLLQSRHRFTRCVDHLKLSLAEVSHAVKARRVGGAVVLPGFLQGLFRIQKWVLKVLSHSSLLNCDPW